MLNISEQSLEGIVSTINGFKLLTTSQRVFEEPVKVVHLQILANQLRFNSARNIKQSTILFVKTVKNLVL